MLIIYFCCHNFSNDDEMLKNCIKNVIEIIKLIYEDTKYLERIKLPTDVEEMYQPLEDLSNCEYFQKNLDDSSTQDIKVMKRMFLISKLLNIKNILSLLQDFFNLFLYFQSQYLLRLCLILVNDKSIAIDYIQNESIMLHNKLQIKIDSLSSPLEFKVTKQTLAEKMEKIQENKCIEIDSASLAKLKRCSADLSYRLIAITREFQWTDESIQVINKQNLTDKEKFEKIFENLVTTEEAIVAHLDDYRRMKLMFYKFIFTNFNLKLEEVNDEKSDGESIDRDEEGENISGKDENSDSGSDFFALRDSVENSSDEESFPNRKQKIEDELQEFDYKIARTNFAPVLKQLKNKIDPLKDEMKERELKFLLAKGFDRERILNSVEGIVNKSEESGSDSGSSLDDFSCPKKSQRNFDEMREFLQSKQQMLILPTMMPNPSMGEEEILE